MLAFFSGVGRPLGAQTASSSTAASSIAPAAAAPAHVLRFRLDLQAMIPATMTVPAGYYAIDVINGAVLAPITVQLSLAGANGAASSMVLQTSGKAGDSRVQSLYTLAPGTYTIGVRSRPEWTATITVVSNKP
jgi:hypothetical protein